MDMLDKSVSVVDGVYKFGGASIGTVDRIKNVAAILKQHQGQRLMVIISAMGKTTNALEKVAEAFFDNRKEDALALFEQVKQQHITLAKYLLVKQYNACLQQLNDFFTEVEWMLHDTPVREFDYYYDQVVCTGELLSTCIVSHFLNEEGISNAWLDVRDVMRTDDNFREATPDWIYTQQQVNEVVAPLFGGFPIVVSQGFIGSTDENESTTLGREGSDYSAAIFANMLNAPSLTIWKDVPSVMNADPRKFEDAVAMPHLSYEEVIEMAYYGAQVIHPKTIKPLFEKKIPLYVKCFLDTNLPGTVISTEKTKGLPPVIIQKEQQVMVEFRSKDYSFVGEKPVADLYRLMEEIRVKPNLTQNGAIGFTAVFDDNRSDKLERLAAAAESIFDVQMRKGLELLTIRHYTGDIVATLLQGKKILLEQKTSETIQAVCE